MLFNSPTFVLFFALVYGLYLVLSTRWQNRMLLVASYVFYGFWDWRFLGLIILSTLVDHVCARAIAGATAQRARKRWLRVSLGVNLGGLAFFKYYNFFAESAAASLGALGVEASPMLLDVVLPVGISFYTFQTLSYTVDVYRGRMAPERDLLVFALYVAYFPQLVAGPIERATHLLPQLRAARRVDWEALTRGAWLVAWGYWLKCFVADNLGPFVDYVFAHAGDVGALEGALGVYAFAFQIFGDFAGYSMIAIGVSRLMGVELMTNFLYPYFVTNPQDFWRHWHISLSLWLRDYLYISLGGNRGARWKVYRNLALTMLLGGLWHGAAWTFVLWGAYQGAILIIHRLWVARRAEGAARLSGWRGGVAWWLRVGWMFQVTCVGWLIFRADSLTQLGAYVGGMVTHGLAWTPLARYGALMLLLHATPCLIILAMQARRGAGNGLEGFSDRQRVALYAFVYFCLTLLAEYGSQRFIYFQF